MSEVRVDPTALGAARRELRAVGQALRTGTPVVRGIAGEATAGAGELAEDLAVGLAAFRLSWTSVVEVLGDSTELVSDALERARAEYARREAALAGTFR